MTLKSKVKKQRGVLRARVSKTVIVFTFLLLCLSSLNTVPRVSAQLPTTCRRDGLRDQKLP